MAQQCVDPNQLVPHLPEVMGVLCRVLQDPFHEVRKVASRTLVLLASTHPSETQLHASVLIKALVPSFAHQHSRMRCEALDALVAVSCCGQTNSSALVAHPNEILKILPSLCRDRASAVREQLITALQRWIALLLNRSQESSSTVLLRALLVMVGDDAPGVAGAAYALLCQTGEHFLQSLSTTRQEDDAAVDMSGSDMGAVSAVAEEEKRLYQKVINQKVHPSFQCTVSPAARCEAGLKDYPAPLNSRPANGPVALVQSHLHILLPEVLSELTEWTEASQNSAVSLLRTLLLLAEDQITAHVQPLLLTLSQTRTASSHKKLMTSALDSCAAILGWFLPPDVALATLTVPLKHEPGAVPITTQLLQAARDANKHTSPKMIRGVVSGMVTMIDNTESLSSVHIADLMSLSEAVAQTGQAELSQLVVLFSQLIVLSRILAESSTDDHSELIQRAKEAEETMSKGDVSKLYCDHAAAVVHELTHGNIAGVNGWTASNLSWKVAGV